MQTNHASLGIGRAICTVLLSCALATASFAASQAIARSNQSSWVSSVRQLIDAKDLPAALTMVEARLQKFPSDVEAQTWHARLLAWMGRWTEAEAEYRRAISASPRDVDILLGLTDVLYWQKNFQSALSTVTFAAEVDPKRADAQIRRGRILRAMGQTELARSAFDAALRLAPGDSEAKAGLESVRPTPRYRLIFRSDFERFNYTTNASSFDGTWTARWSSRWSTALGGDYLNRFGQKATRLHASGSFHVSPNDSVTAGGATAHDEGVIAHTEAFFEYTHGFRFEGGRTVRGLEASYQQHWLWYRGARVLVLTPAAVLYLPRNWNWIISLSIARSRFSGAPAAWQPSGRTQLSFPLRSRVSGNVFFGVGTENFARAEEVGRFSARTWGGGLKVEMTSRQDFSVYGFYQNRSQGRTEHGFGMAYGIRF